MKSIRTRLLFAIAAIVIISGLAISQSIIHQYRKSLYENTVHQAQNIAQNLALNVADKILINDIVSLQRLLNDRIRTDEAVGYLFVIRDGEILAHTFPEGVPAQLVRESGPENGEIRKVQSREGERYMDVSRPIADGYAGVLRLGYAEAPLEKQIFLLWTQASIITALLLFAALATGLVLVRQITRPLVKLTETVDHVDPSHLGITVHGAGDDETGRLAGAFNNMLARLRSSVEQLEKSKATLESKNRALERAHQQTRSLFEINRGIGALSDLQKICAFLVNRLSGIISCEIPAIFLYPGHGQPPVVFSGGSIRTVADGQRENMDRIVAFGDDYRFFEPSEIPEGADGGKYLARVAVFPFYHENRLIGALLAGCTAECECMESDLQILRMMLDQSSGAIHRALLQENERKLLEKRVEQSTGYSGLVGKDPQMQLVYQLIEDVAASDATVLIEGESGTGKEVAARSIHENSPRKGKPFVVINCSAYPVTLLESELFGHEKGAFTGAVKRKAGRFEQAEDGTVFLDEIADIPPAAQVKLLRVLQNRKIERIGGDAAIDVNIRILAATNKNLISEVKEGRFREDLFYRLNVIPMHMPPLRNRRNDIPRLARHFLGRCNDLQKKSVRDFDAEAMRRLLEHPWPGNVRELENTVEHAVVLARNDVIMLSDLPASLSAANTVSQTVESAGTTLEANEKTLLIDMLTRCNWNKKEAARRLGIGRSTLYAKLKRFHITPPER